MTARGSAGDELAGLLLAATDVGPDREDEPFTPGERTGSCDPGVPVMPSPKASAGAGYVSNAAPQRITEELLEYESVEDAAGVFESAGAAAGCSAEGNLEPDAGRPASLEVAGADAAYSVGFTNENDSIAFIVARAGATVAVLHTEIHHGAATVDNVGLVDVAAVALTKVAAG